MKRVICKSGQLGWRKRLRKIYAGFGEFKRYAEIYNLHIRLGYKTPETAWRYNPLIEGSVNPGDYRKVRS